MKTIEIKAGDRFLYSGQIHVCVGRDKGLVWYESNETMDSISVEPGMCERLKKEELQIIDLFENDPNYKLFRCDGDGVFAQIKNREGLGYCPICLKKSKVLEAKKLL